MSPLTLSQWPAPVDTLGNAAIMGLPKTAFFCSRRFPAGAVLPAYDWARQMRAEERCVISGSHSAIEKDVFEILLGGRQPLILALARTLPRRIAAPLAQALEQERLLIVSPFPASARRPTVSTARRRNEFMLAIADAVVAAHADRDGKLTPLLLQSQKPLRYLR